MSLINVCQNVLAETGWPVLTSIVNNTDGTARQMLAIANAELAALSEQLNWPQLQVEYPFSTVPNQTVYLWPANFRVLAGSSVFNADQYVELKGSTGLQFWELLKYGKLSSLVRPRFKVTYPLGVPGIEITPPPAGISALVAVYYTKMFVRGADGAEYERFNSDGDTSIVPERYLELGVKWRFRRAKGMDFSAELAEYNNTVQTQYSKYNATGEITIGGRRAIDGITSGYVRETGFGA